MSFSLWPDLSNRDLQPELMDDPDIDQQSHRLALAGLARVNRISRSAAVVWRPIERLIHEEGRERVRILDLACGGGDVTLGVARLAKRHGVNAELLGIDFSETAVGVARRRAAESNTDNVAFELGDVLNDELPEGYDVVTTSLFIHHLTESDAMALLGKMASASRLLVINDLHRTRGALFLAHVGCRLFTRSPVVRYDGPQSIKAAFTLKEMAGLCQRANLAGCRIEARWPGRLAVIWRRAD